MSRATHVSRRGFLERVGLVTGGAMLLPVLAACQAAAPPTPEPRVVEKTVEKVVTQVVTQVVEKPVEKVVEKPVQVEVTRVVEKQVAVKPEITTLVITIGAAGIKDEAITGRPAEGKFGNWFEVEVFDQHVQKFMDENPKIKVVIDWFPGRPFDQKILAKKAAGQLGDIVHGLGLGLDVAAKNEIYRPLDDLVKSANFDLKQYLPNSIDALRLDAKTAKRGAGAPLMGLPRTIGPGGVVLFYNAEMFEKKGVKAPTSEMSYDDLVKTGLAMTERKSGAEVADVYGWLVSPFWFGNVTNTWLRDFGGEFIDQEGKKAQVNTPEAMAMAQFVYDAIYKHKFSPRPDQLEALGQYKNMFLQQKLAMFRLPPWGVLATSDMPLKGEKGYFEWSAVATPKGPGGQRGTELDVSHIGIAPTSKSPDEAFKLMAWTTNKAAGVLQCFAAGMCGPRPDTFEDEKVKKSAYLSVVNPVLASARLAYYAANGRDSEAGGAFGKEWDKLLNNQAKPEKAFFDGMNKQVQDVLDRPPA